MTPEWAQLAAQLSDGYRAAQDLYGDSYADYLQQHDDELLAKGVMPLAWPLSLQGNDGE